MTKKASTWTSRPDGPGRADGGTSVGSVEEYFIGSDNEGGSCQGSSSPCTSDTAVQTSPRVFVIGNYYHVQHPRTADMWSVGAVTLDIQRHRSSSAFWEMYQAARELPAQFWEISDTGRKARGEVPGVLAAHAHR